MYDRELRGYFEYRTEGRGNTFDCRHVQNPNGQLLCCEMHSVVSVGGRMLPPGTWQPLAGSDLRCRPPASPSRVGQRQSFHRVRRPPFMNTRPCPPTPQVCTPPVFGTMVFICGPAFVGNSFLNPGSARHIMVRRRILLGGNPYRPP